MLNLKMILFLNSYLTAVVEGSRVTRLFGSQQIFQLRLKDLSTVLREYNSCLYCDRHVREDKNHKDKLGHNCTLPHSQFLFFSFYLNEYTSVSMLSSTLNCL